MISIFVSLGRNLVCLSGAFKHVNLDADFKLEKDKKDCSTYLSINSGEVRDALQVVLNGVRAISLREDKPTVSGPLYRCS